MVSTKISPFFFYYYLLSSLPQFWGRLGLFFWVSVLKYLLLDLFPPAPYLRSGGSSHLCRCLLWGPLSSRLKLLTLQKKKKSKALLKLPQTPGGPWLGRKDLLHQLTRRKRSRLQDTFQLFYLSVAQTSSPPPLPPSTNAHRYGDQRRPPDRPPFRPRASLPVSVSGYRFN